MTFSTALAGGLSGPLDTVRPLVTVATEALAKGAATRGGPIAPATPSEVDDLVRETVGEVLRAEGTGAAEALRVLTELVAHGAADPVDPSCAAHLHCPPLGVAVAADLVVSTLNQSLDSWDQSPAATALEPIVIEGLARLVGYDPAQADGAVTTGGTESNLMGVLFARNLAIGAHTGCDVGRSGMPESARPRVFCSGAAHFSASRNAGFLGMGEDAVVAVDTDEHHRMSPKALRAALEAARAEDALPVAVFATAGTTDLGAIDPLDDIADLAREFGVWLHVDAAFGGGALFSSRLRGLLHGLERADSVGLDLHKLGWQPVPAGVFLVRDKRGFSVLEQKVEYLITEDDLEAGFPNLLGHSMRTTRRPDVFKLAVTLRALGTTRLGTLVDRCYDLAQHAAAEVERRPRLRLHSRPTLTTVLFRYEPDSGDGNELNGALRRRLFRSGAAVIGRTELAGAVWLKFTLLNPHTTERDINAMLDAVITAGDREEA